MKILVLGGTGEARDLAERLTTLGHAVTTSLAGRTREPLLPAGELRVGKFGGIPGLVGYLGARGFDRLVDATHPYAGLISINAVAAAQQSGTPLVRLMRPAWIEPEGADWRHVPDIVAAADALPSDAVVLVTTGHEGLDALLARDDCRLLVRLIEPPDAELPRHARLLLSRPPHSFDDERALFAREAITHLVTKNSGGAQTSAKLAAAREAGAEVIMIARPVYGPAVEVGTVGEAIAALRL
ncbi:MAG: cobalt-precorrin-6A reductase [Devosia nanyangense]|uniref:Cobalt-precorrin-6A reductase n=1 Tax=Devosia nanyangense TaxID=1228055 RepID=A0A933L1A3_9HYPH|nr:cobalt-precorrin-6A reductase [Devosia nanyangense]